MKKLFFCFLFAFCVLFSIVVLADNSCSCTCDSCSQNNTSYSFSHEIVKGDYHVFIPPEFDKELELPAKLPVLPMVCYLTTAKGIRGPAIYLALADKDDEFHPAYYSDTDELFHLLEGYAEGREYEIVQVGECLGIKVIYDDGYASDGVVIYSTNRKNLLKISLRGDTIEDCLSLSDGILEHIVAPEMPL